MMIPALLALVGAPVSRAPIVRQSHRLSQAPSEIQPIGTSLRQRNGEPVEVARRRATAAAAAGYSEARCRRAASAAIDARDLAFARDILVACVRSGTDRTPRPDGGQAYQADPV